ncbi:MAG TPA: VOC family protein [Streptosporangiaceae bacterium]|nr:VOC family protein [Streptosporangiaceae bacterium]
MSATVLNITFDCTAPGTVARFWAAVTGWALHEEGTWDGHEEFSVGSPAEGGIRLYFVGVPEPKAVKNRLHLDVVPHDRSQREEVARLVGLGASVAEDQPADVGWVVMADPEGNEFCVERGD